MTSTAQLPETTFEPTQATFEIDDAGNSAVRALSNTQTWGPGQGYPYAWDPFISPRFEQPGTWRAVRHNWRTGGVVLQLGTDGNFGPVAVSQAGWARKRFRVEAGRNDFRIDFRMGPVTERPSSIFAQGKVFAHLVPNTPYAQEQFATAHLPAGGLVTLNLRTLVPGNAYDLYVGCTTLLVNPGSQPYCEVIVNDIKVHHTLSPYYAASAGDTTGTEAPKTRGEKNQPPKALDLPEDLDLSHLDPTHRPDLDSLHCGSIEGTPEEDWVVMEG
ncbi:MAG: hypothetical protein SX243_00945 [Acidobacteriota bacterium]|nr:hypothetical protein [Acidobacteriota bacterium]